MNNAPPGSVADRIEFRASRRRSDARMSLTTHATRHRVTSRRGRSAAGRSGPVGPGKEALVVEMPRSARPAEGEASATSPWGPWLLSERADFWVASAGGGALLI